jgi:hypothetical protein
MDSNQKNLDDPLVPLHLLLWAGQTVLTTSTCLIEMWSWTDRTEAQKYKLTAVYAPFIAYGMYPFSSQIGILSMLIDRQLL